MTDEVRNPNDRPAGRPVAVAEREVVNIPDVAPGGPEIQGEQVLSVRVAVLGDVPKVLTNAHTVQEVSEQLGLGNNYEFRVNGFPADMRTQLHDGDAVIAVPNVDGGR